MCPQEDMGKVSSGNRNSMWGGLKQEKSTGLVLGQRGHELAGAGTGRLSLWKAREYIPFSLSCTGEGNGNPLQYSFLENPGDREAWWVAVYGVAQSQTRLKWLSSSSKGHFTFCVRMGQTSLCLKRMRKNILPLNLKNYSVSHFGVFCRIAGWSMKEL